MSYIALNVDQAREVARAMTSIAGEVDGVLGEVGRICSAVGVEVEAGEFNLTVSSWLEISQTITDVLNTKADQMQDILWPTNLSEVADLMLQQASGAEAGLDAELMEDLNGVAADSPSVGWQPPNYDKPGDPEWDPDPELISAWDPATGSVQWRGRSTVTRLLEMMYDPTKTAPDEFLVVKLENGKYMLGLPGVTDLSKPDFPGTLWGATPTNTVRNTLGAAQPSHLSTDIDDNAYALMVRDYIRLNIPQGADLVIVGHSFGADSSIDIANDPETRKMVNIEAVVAAGYDSNEQLNDLDADIPVLAYQNRLDRIVMGENALYHPAQIMDSTDRYVKNMVTVQPKKAAVAALDQVTDLWNAGFAATTSLGNPMLGLGTTTYGPNQSNIVFQGGLEGHGHDPSNYTHYIDLSLNPVVVDFMAILGDAGYDGAGDAYVVDVSDPG